MSSAASSAAPATSTLPQTNYHRDVLYEKVEGGEDTAPNVDGVRAVARAVLDLSEEISDGDMEVSVVSGGITNKLFKVNFACRRQPVLVRVFGAEGMIDRDLENAMYEALAAAGVGPGYHGRFGNGRIETFLEGMVPLSLDDMADPQVSHQVAAQMARLHRYELPELLKPFHSSPVLWPQLWSWLNQARRDVGEGKLAARGAAVERRFAESLQDMVGDSFSRAEAELKGLEDLLPADLPTAFCNNDLLAGNILRHQTTGEVQLIDFEYGGCNYRGFEIANHWNEWAGGTTIEMQGATEYERFPSESQQLEFCRSYLGCSTQHEEAADKGKDAEVQDLLREARLFVLVNHWYWGLWAVNQAIGEGIEEFDYLRYAENRLKRYYEERGA